MSHGTFNGPALSTYTKDWQREAWYAAQEQERRATEMGERAGRWLAGQLAGRDFATLAALHEAAIECAEARHGGLDPEQDAAILRGCVLIWIGECDRDSLYRKCVERSETGIRFSVAA